MTQKVHSHKERKDSLKTRVEPVFYLCIHFMPGWTATSHEVKKKEAQKDQSSVSKEPTYNRCLLILHFKPFRS